MANTNGCGSLRAVLYARVSTREQAEKGYSLRQQIEALRAYAEHEGLEIVAEIEDGGYSGAYLDRPGLDRVRGMVEAGGVAFVLAQDRDRLAREPAYLYLLREEFLRHGCALRALNDRGDDSPEGQLTDGILDQLAKFERAKTAERTRRGSRRKVGEGLILGAGCRPRYGFSYVKDGKGKTVGYAVNEGEMAVVRRLLAALADGTPTNAVRDFLEREAIRAPRGGRLWSRDTIRNIVAEDAYRPHSFAELEEIATSGRLPRDVLVGLDPSRLYGVAWYGRTKTRRAGIKRSPEPAPSETWIAVPVDLAGSGLDRETVERARRNLAGNRAPSKVGDRFFELSGVLKCADCGRTMIGYARRFKSETKKDHYYYRCNQRQKVRGTAEDCLNRKSHRAADLERRAWEVVAQAAHDPQGEFLRQLEEAYGGRKGELSAGSGARRAGLLEALAKIETRRDGFYDLAADNTMPRETLRRKLADLEKQERALRAELERAGDAARDLEALEKAYAAAMEALTSGRVKVEEETTPEGRRARYKRTGMAFTADSEGTLRAGWALQSDATC